MWISFEYMGTVCVRICVECKLRPAFFPLKKFVTRRCDRVDCVIFGVREHCFTKF